VWFNAWHHQKEDQMLAALLQAVKTQAVPPLWQLSGAAFRGRLVLRRLHRYLFELFLLIGAVVLVDKIGHFVTTTFHFTAVTLAQWISGKGDSSATAKLAEQPIFAILAAAAALYKVVSSGLTAFGTNPASLLASVSGGTKIKDLNAQTSFRQQFASEFADVTRSLGKNQRMLVLIDDLDRCRPEKVREVLEGVNFLASSGDCFIVLGMARDIVEHCVGLSFARVVDTMSWEAMGLTDRDIARALEEARQAAERKPRVQESAGAAGNDVAPGFEAFAKRHAFAHLYLDKLIQIEVTVPEPTPVQRRLLFRSEEEIKRDENQSEQRVQNIMQISRRMYGLAKPVMAAALIALLAFGVWISVSPAVGNWLESIVSPADSKGPKESQPNGAVGSVHPTKDGGWLVTLTTPAESKSPTSSQPSGSLIWIHPTKENGWLVSLAPPANATSPQASPQAGTTASSTSAIASTTRSEAPSLTPSSTNTSSGTNNATVTNPRSTAENQGSAGVSPYGVEPSRSPAIEEYKVDRLTAGWPFYVVWLGTISLIATALRRLPQRIVRDEAPFTNALSIWHPLVMTGGAKNTPRTARRFQNRVRYLAMRQRALLRGKAMSLGERWLRDSLDSPLPLIDRPVHLPETQDISEELVDHAQEIRGFVEAGQSGTSGEWRVKVSADRIDVTSGANPKMPSEQFKALVLGNIYIPEPVLIALAAIEEYAPEWILDENLFRTNVAHPSSEPDGARVDMFNKTLTEHIQKWQDWHNLEQYRSAYLALCSELSRAGTTNSNNS
jgi:hypothetical protein